MSLIVLPASSTAPFEACSPLGGCAGETIPPCFFASASLTATIGDSPSLLITSLLLPPPGGPKLTVGQGHQGEAATTTRLRRVAPRSSAPSSSQRGTEGSDALGDARKRNDGGNGGGGGVELARKASTQETGGGTGTCDERSDERQRQQRRGERELRATERAT